MNRRDFINKTALSAFVPLLPFMRKDSPIKNLLALADDADAEICRQKFDLAVSEDLVNKPINEVIVAMGKSFIGTEYGAHVLEEPGPEHLVINMRALDCVSFYENSLVLARCIKMKKFTFDDYKAQLQFIRYRHGIINGYPSRLHYTTDYWYDNEKKGVLKIATEELFGKENLEPIPKPINFMTTHRDLYKQLADDKFYEAIKKQEDIINSRDMYFMPKGNLHMFEDKIPTGSLIGIATNIPGMDIKHTGIAVRMDDGTLHFMHAPNVGYKVQITEGPLHEYLEKFSNDTGIIVAEALEPKK